MKKILAVLIFIFSAPLTYAGISKTTYVAGRVKSWDQQVIRLQQFNGSIVSVARSKVSEKIALQEGQLLRVRLGSPTDVRVIQRAPSAAKPAHPSKH